MLTLPFAPHAERRSLDRENDVTGSYTQGIKRLEKVIAERYAKHDLKFQTYDASEWQVMYSLLNHNTRVRDVVEKVASHLGWNERDFTLAAVAAGWHDLGKIDPTCWKYRLMRLFHVEERHELTQRHQLMSGRAVMNLKVHVREEDRPFIGMTSLIVRYHHNDPSDIPMPYIVPKCLLVRMADIFITVQEDRGYQPGISLWGAVDVIKGVAENWSKNSNFAGHMGEVEKISNAINELWGAESVGVANPL